MFFDLVQWMFLSVPPLRPLAFSSKKFPVFDSLEFISLKQAEKWQNQPKTDLLPLYEKVKEYAGLIPQLSGALETAKEAESRLSAITEQNQAVGFMNNVTFADAFRRGPRCRTMMLSWSKDVEMCCTF